MTVARADKVRIGKLIKNQRIKEKKSLRTVAAECDMSYATLNDIEHGDGFPTPEVILKLTQALNFPLKKRHKLLDDYGAIKKTAPPDIDQFLTSMQGKELAPLLRVLQNKELTALQITELTTLITQMEDRKHEQAE